MRAVIWSSTNDAQDMVLSTNPLQVINNPNADKGCGCGTSFSPK